MRLHTVAGLPWLALLALAGESMAFYIPGWSIRSYKDSEAIPLLVNKVYSDNTQLQYGYFDLPFVCPPTGQPLRHGTGGFLSGQSVPLNLGEVLRGDRIHYSDMDLAMGTDVACRFLCRRDVTRRDLRWARDLVRDGYVVEWIVDNLPGATSFVTVDKSRRYYASGFKLGFTDFATDPSSGRARPRYFLNNHHTVVVKWRRAPGRAGDRGGKVVVGFEVYTKSVGLANPRDPDGCPADLREIEQNLELVASVGADGSNRTVDNAAETAKQQAAQLSPEVAAIAPQYRPPVGLDEDELLGGKGVDEDAVVLTVPYSYSVYFAEDNTVEWSRRWDLYFANQEEGSRIHWLAIVNSLAICALLTATVLMILAKTVRGDIKSYNNAREAAALLEEGAKLSRKRRSKHGSGSSSTLKVVSEKAAAAGALLEPEGSDGGGVVVAAGSKASLADDDDAAGSDADDGAGALEDVTGWKLLHADVFRPPRHGRVLAPLVGSGVQLLSVAAGLVALSALGVLNPSLRGGFISSAVGLFVFAGLFSGYFSARVWRTFTAAGDDGSVTTTATAADADADWRRNALVTALLFPGLVFALVFALNLMVWAQASSTALPLGTLLSLALLWLCIQVPLVYLGAWIAVRRPGLGPDHGAWRHPTKTSAVPRQVPSPQPWYLRPAQSVLLAGLFPFGVIFIELLFVFQSLWLDKSGYYYVFGFAAVVAVILVAAVAEVTVVAVYLQLCAENHAWWWRSFLVGGGSAVWVFLYCAWYYAFKLHIHGIVSSLLFFAYSGLACIVYGLLTGTIGFLAAYAFVRRIYGAIKAD